VSDLAQRRKDAKEHKEKKLNTEQQRDRETEVLTLNTFAFPCVFPLKSLVYRTHRLIIRFGATSML
jgi:hypothetical protein